MYGHNFPTLHDIFDVITKYVDDRWHLSIFILQHNLRRAVVIIHMKLKLRFQTTRHMNFMWITQKLSHVLVWFNGISYESFVQFVRNSYEIQMNPQWLFCEILGRFLFYCCKRFISILLELPINLLGNSFELHMKFWLITHAMLGTCYYEVRLCIITISYEIMWWSQEFSIDFLFLFVFYILPMFYPFSLSNDFTAICTVNLDEILWLS